MADTEESQREFRLCQYLDGQMSRRERQEFERQIQADETLREELRLYASLDGLLGGLGQEEAGGLEVNYDQQRAEIVAAAEKRALLAPARHRPLLLRPTFAVLAAAAVVLLMVAAAALVIPPTVGPTKVPERLVTRTPSVSVQLLSGERQEAGQGAITVQFQQPQSEEMPLESPMAALPSAPAGTVVVSVGPLESPEAASDSSSLDAMFVY